MPLQYTSHCSIPYKVLNALARHKSGDPKRYFCTFGEKEYASKRQPTVACDNRLVKSAVIGDPAGYCVLAGKRSTQAKE